MEPETKPEPEKPAPKPAGGRPASLGKIMEETPPPPEPATWTVRDGYFAAALQGLLTAGIADRHAVERANLIADTAMKKRQTG